MAARWKNIGRERSVLIIWLARQSGKIDGTLSAVLYDSKFWKGLVNFRQFADTGLVRREDPDLFGFAGCPRQARDGFVETRPQDFTGVKRWRCV